jgi:AcrR family transcriptional regulator
VAGGRTRQGDDRRNAGTPTGLDPNLTADWRHYSPLTLGPILDAAVETFREHGYHGSSVREIASRVGVTVPTLYYYYGNKQGLLVELLTGSMHDVLTRCRHALAEAGERPEQRLANLVECTTLYMAQRRALAFVHAEIRGLEPENRARYVAQRDELSAMLRQTVLDGVDDGAFSTNHPVDAARAILSMCQAVADWYRPGGPLGEAELAKRYAEIALDTVGHRPRPGRSGAASFHAPDIADATERGPAPPCDPALATSAAATSAPATSAPATSAASAPLNTSVTVEANAPDIDA